MSGSPVNGMEVGLVWSLLSTLRISRSINVAIQTLAKQRHIVTASPFNKFIIMLMNYCYLQIA
jgi:hypothetical protein